MGAPATTSGSSGAGDWGRRCCGLALVVVVVVEWKPPNTSAWRPFCAACGSNFARLLLLALSLLASLAQKAAQVSLQCREVRARKEI